MRLHQDEIGEKVIILQGEGQGSVQNATGAGQQTLATVGMMGWRNGKVCPGFENLDCTETSDEREHLLYTLEDSDFEWERC